MLFIKKNLYPKRTKARLIAAFLIAFGYSICYYLFFQLSREIFRIDDFVWEFSFVEIQFYNIFFAFLALIFGQAAGTIFYFSGPKRQNEFKYYRRLSLLLDQQVPIMVFLMWFAEVASIYGFWSGLVYHDFQLIFSFFPSYCFLFILIIIMLFFQLWTTARKIFKSQSLKWMSINFALLCLLSLFLSRIQMVSHSEWASIEEHYKKKELPKSIPEYNMNFRLQDWNVIKDYAVFSADSNYIISENDTLDLKEFEERIKLELSTNSEKNKRSRRHNIRLYIDSTVQMNQIMDINTIVAKHSNHQNLAYAYRPTHKTFNTNFGILSRPINWEFIVSEVDALNALKAMAKNGYSISINKNGELFYKDELIKPNILMERLISDLDLEPKTTLLFYYSEESEFHQYLDVRLTLKKFKEFQKSEAVKKRKAIAFNYLDKEDRNLIIKNELSTTMEIPDRLENQLPFLKRKN